MKKNKAYSTIIFGIVAFVAAGGLWGPRHTVLVSAQTVAATPNVAVGPQYDTTHVYVPATDFDRFVGSVLQTFGGTTSQEGVFTVTPTPSSTRIQLVLTPVGTLSVFGFKTPIPFPFGVERTGYLVTSLDGAVRAAQAACADVLVAPFDDPIGTGCQAIGVGVLNPSLHRRHAQGRSIPSFFMRK